MASKEYISCEMILFNPTNPKSGKPYFTIKSTGFAGSWKAGETTKLLPSKQQSKSVEEIRDIRAELKALSSPDIWDLPPERCSEKTTLRRRRYAYLGDRLILLTKEEDKS